MKHLRITLIALLLGTASCGEVQTLTTPSPSDITTQPIAVVHVTDFFSSALISIVTNLASVIASDITTNIVEPLPHTDAVMRSFLGRLYIVNRLGRDSIQVVDPTNGFETIAEFSTGAGTNPQDILVISATKAYVTLFNPENAEGVDDVLIINPQDGTIIDTIDLTFLTDNDGDRNARVTQLLSIGNEVWVLLQDLSSDFIADTHGKIAVIDNTTDEIVDTDPIALGLQGIQLKGRNPSDIAYNEALGQVLISMTGVFQPDFTTDTSDHFGGIEAVDVVTYRSQGIVVDDAELGGHPRGIEIASINQAFTIVSDTRVVSFDPTALEVLSIDVYQSPGFFLPEILLDGDDHLLITERGDFEGQGAGLVILDIGNDFEMQGPLDVGGPPSAVTIIGGA